MAPRAKKKPKTGLEAVLKELQKVTDKLKVWIHKAKKNGETKRLKALRKKLKKVSALSNSVRRACPRTFVALPKK